MIQIVEKPEWVSWEDIHNVLWVSHSENRRKGIVMRFPSLSCDVIKRIVERNGKMLVAIDDNKVVGTAAIKVRNENMWCGKGKYAYMCFASVLPEYNGKGVFKALDSKREEIALSLGLNKMLADTHEKNTRRLEIAKKAGYRFVDYKFYRDHYNVVMVKWLDGCPYSEFRCRVEFTKSKIAVKTKRFLNGLLRKGK